jgi:hypothetical protein
MNKIYNIRKPEELESLKDGDIQDYSLYEQMSTEYLEITFPSGKTLLIVNYGAEYNCNLRFFDPLGSEK